MYDKLSRIDLNLLVVFSALYDEKNASRAAKRLFVTQPAMSGSLARLRTLFDDPLFTRQSHGLAPTPLADSLAQPINDLLAQTMGVVFPSDFSPAQVRANIHVGMQDCYASIVIPKLMTVLAAQAPGINLTLHAIPVDSARQLQQGEIDFICTEAPWDADDIHSVRVGRFRASCLMNKNHPLACKSVISEKDFLSSNRIVYRNPLSLYREAHDFCEKSRNLKSSAAWHLETSEFLVALELIKLCGAIMVVASGMENYVAYKEELVAKEIEIELSDYNVFLHLIQHQRTVNSPIHTWFRNELATVVGQVFPLVDTA